MREDISGNRYGRLIAMNYESTGKDRRAIWECICDCGNTSSVSVKNLKSGNSKSCGCLQIDAARVANTRHGLARRSGHDIRYDMYVAAKCRSKKNGIFFDLLLDEVPAVPEKCPVLGISIEKSRIKNSENSPTIDRIIPAAGYTKNNVRIISHRANALKSNATINELSLIYADSLNLLRHTQ